MAYVLGFFAADGYMTQNKRGACFWNIQINDHELLKEIKRTLESEHEISTRKKLNKNEKVSYRLQIGSKEMYEDLISLGMRQNKTKSLTAPNVPDEFLGSFIRGYFDGDGHVWCGLVHKERKTSTIVLQTVFTSCSLKFLETIKLRMENFGIKKGKISKGKGAYYRLVYSVVNSLNLYYFMYNGLSSSKLFLPRKRRIFDKYIKMRS